MAEAPSLLAIIPARGGSKRLPGKNILPLAGKPLIAWTIDAALGSSVFASVLVSTDDEAIAQVARHCGAQVPWLRPAELAGDTASSADVLRHALRWYEGQYGEVDAAVLLQPTTPFRTAGTIRSAVAQYLAQDQRQAVVSVSPASPHPAWCFSVQGTQLTPFHGWDQLALRSQDLPPAYALNGAIYVFPAEQLRVEGPLLTPQMQAFVMNDLDESLDIDTPADWQLAEAIAQARAQRPG